MVADSLVRSALQMRTPFRLLGTTAMLQSKLPPLGCGTRSLVMQVCATAPSGRAPALRTATRRERRIGSGQVASGSDCGSIAGSLADPEVTAALRGHGIRFSILGCDIGPTLAPIVQLADADQLSAALACLRTLGYHTRAHRGPLLLLVAPDRPFEDLMVCTVVSPG